MKMSWYYRVLLSYTPIFFVVISVLIFSFFAQLNASMKKQIDLTDKAIATKVMQVIDANLKATERVVIKEMYQNATFKSFFSDTDGKELYDYFMISQKMDQFASVLPFSSSIYLYNEKTGQVLSRSGISALEQFGDRDFVEEAYRSKPAYAWTSPRTFREFVNDPSEEYVVSLAKQYPSPADKTGVLVVNVRVSSLIGFVKDLTRYDDGLVQLFTPNRIPFDKINSHSALPPDAGDEIVPTRSEYTGWLLYSGGTSSRRLSLLAFLNNWWLVVGFTAIVTGLIGFTYITHRNYKPIRSIAGRIREYAKRKSEELIRQTSPDEIKFIDAAIDGLLERTIRYEQSHKDDLLIRKRQLFFEWLEGHKKLSEAEWGRELEKLQIRVPYRWLGVAVLEIDRFARFSETYNDRDRYLFKYVVSNVLQEIAQESGMFIWNEWLEPQQMAVVLFLNCEPVSNEEGSCGMMKKLQSWVGANLEFTVSVGVGPYSRGMVEVPDSYKMAKEALSCKPVFGVGALITQADVRYREEGRIYPHLQLVRSIAKSLRLDDGQWTSHLNHLYEALSRGLVSQGELKSITLYLKNQFGKELPEMGDDIGRLWADEYASKLAAVADQAETLGEWYDRLGMLFAALEPRIREVRTVKNQHAVMTQVKEYIETHYADPELSLIRVSDRFGMNPRYLSKLFKEEFGEKFIDYMMRLRLEKARRLLLDTDLPVQSVAETVGYVHVISFHRAFKNMFGMPPGDYRKKAEIR
ncbi:helix-turn-helix domain-containing protein [Paenibacillus hamazuiensis]|uniref:helix-turn-helix domain-containing protein n=1 Tax=Paenibacillus hamazuiensis TaxID=2936508 RepID=UPI002010035B|nr:AraC family transcriptional regulator [Paenibacillus hamazuiensis]